VSASASRFSVIRLRPAAAGLRGTGRSSVFGFQLIGRMGPIGPMGLIRGLDVPVSLRLYVRMVFVLAFSLDPARSQCLVTLSVLPPIGVRVLCLRLLFRRKDGWRVRRSQRSGCRG